MVPDEDAGVLAAARAIASGQPVDWAAIESSGAVSPSLAAILRELKVVAEIAELHRSFPPVAATPESSSADSSASIAAGTTETIEREAVWGSLRLLERVGHGAFGDVFRAWDPRLDREVALKLLRRVEAGHGSVGSAVVDEGRLLARVRHPNVVTVYGADRIDGRVGLWMEFVHGRTLEAVLRDHGPFSAREAALIGVDLCRALAAVHHAGLIHRDIKAQNVMREAGGRTVLMDFGAGREDLDGMPPEMAGTPLYLAPEVFAGAAATVRSDLYSVGVLLYHLVSGSYPVKRSTVAGIQQEHRQRRRACLRDDRPDLPDAFVEAVERALAFDPDTRYESAGAMQAALAPVVAAAETVAPPPVPVTTVRRAAGRGLGIAAALILATAAAVGTWRWTRTSATRVAPAPRYILVGAFDNHTGDPRLDDVVQFAFEQELAQSHALTVVPPERIADTLSLMKRPATTRLDAATEREVCIRDGAIPIFASGRIDQLGKKYTINVTITEAPTGAAVLRAGADAPDIDGILDAVRTLARKVRSGTGENAAQVAADARLERVTTDSLAALQQYSSGVALVNERRWAAAELPLRDAIRLDPTFASAHIMLAHCVNNQTRPAREYLPLAQRAFELSASLPDRERYFIAGSYYGMTGDVARATAAYEVLVQGYPNDYWGTNNLVGSYRQTGRHSEAAGLLVKLATLRPNDFATLAQAAEATLVQGDTAGARSIVGRATALTGGGNRSNPTRAWVRLFPVFELWADGRVAEAAASLDAVVGGERISNQLAQGVGMMNLAMGRIVKAEQAFHALSLSDEPFEFFSLVELARGDTARARDALLRDPRLADMIHGAPPGPSAMDAWLLVRFGMIDEADALVREWAQPGDTRIGVLGARAEVLAARGDSDAAIALFSRVQERERPGTAFGWRELESLGDALIRRGEWQSAATVLRKTDLPRRMLYPLSGSSGYPWMRARTRLLAVERRLGHVDRAARIEQELRSLLVLADPDFALLREINAPSR